MRIFRIDAYTLFDARLSFVKYAFVQYLPMWETAYTKLNQRCIPRRRRYSYT
jgi:hypothetical protein